VITYADGRVVSTILGERPYRSWTPMFPQVASSPENGDLPLEALEYVAAREENGVRVAISLRFGRPHQQQRPVTEVLVTPGTEVTVAELERFGVEPVRLSLAPVGPLALAPPSIESDMPSLDMWLDDVVTDAPPRYS
jgi:hypothetical protein